MFESNEVLCSISSQKCFYISWGWTNNYYIINNRNLARSFDCSTMSSGQQRGSPEYNKEVVMILNSARFYNTKVTNSVGLTSTFHKTK